MSVIHLKEGVVKIAVDENVEATKLGPIEAGDWKVEVHDGDVWLTHQDYTLSKPTLTLAQQADDKEIVISPTVTKLSQTLTRKPGNSNVTSLVLDGQHVELNCSLAADKWVIVAYHKDEDHVIQQLQLIPFMYR
eukprot:Blabericola_migrator_1__4671@NODE_246_length_10907_cov_93_324631_g208_i0_p5_GENE_NODE_246_length_10907_cov_93_324631_g208_i0NODE_246_length_10907_cov_93_324631_g208_i0_p5_ORF_typecomplete_len134_score27_76DUF2917/PF11142_8/0_12DUF2917/PF11142_8/6_6e02_NODE_246_length_10907_cov_93_324631_g208_i0507908